MDKVLEKPINGWTRFNLGPFHVDSVSYLTEVHWDTIEFFQSCLLKGCGIMEFDCEGDGRYVLTYSSLGMELRNGVTNDLIWENVTYSDICKGALRMFTDIIMDFDDWCWWTAGDEGERDEARDDLAILLVDFCKLLIHEGVLQSSVQAVVPEHIREYASAARARMGGKIAGKATSESSASGSGSGSPSNGDDGGRTSDGEAEVMRVEYPHRFEADDEVDESLYEAYGQWLGDNMQDDEADAFEE